MAVRLSDRHGDQGALERLLLAEAKDPSKKASYVAADSLLSMQWMKRVLQNRLDNKPAQFLAPNAKSLLDIIKAPNQFAGFMHYPSYDQDLVKRLQSILDIANNPKDVRSGDYMTFVQNALDVAKAPVMADPAKAQNPKIIGICAWKTKDAPSPGPRYIKFQTLAGNDFYSLSS